MAATWPDSLQEAEGRPKKTYRLAARPLETSQVDELVTAYQAGTGVKKLAKQFGIHRETVGKHLKARSIGTTPPTVTAEEIAEAADLYREGWSLARLAAKFGIDDDTIRARLLELGVVMRKPGRQKRIPDPELL